MPKRIGIKKMRTPREKGEESKSVVVVTMYFILIAVEGLISVRDR
jgi:hypothetical protein